MTSSRERFEAWHSRNYDTMPDTELHRVERQGMLKAWRVRDAEVARLVEALREAQPAVDRGLSKHIDALLREYDTPKETRDE